MTDIRPVRAGIPGGPGAALAARVGASLTSILIVAAARATRRARSRGDRGDVPGWVLVTLMTAGLVLVLWGVARDRLTTVFNDAIDGVLGGP